MSAWNKLSIGYKLNDIFFITKDIAFSCGDNGLIIKTIDGGLTWNVVASGVTNNLSKIFFPDASIGFIAGSDVILRTIDNGVTWQIVATPGSIVGINVTLLHTNADDIFFSSIQRGYIIDGVVIYSTSTGGNTWEARDLVGPGYNININNGTSLYFSTNNIGYLVGQSIGGEGIILKTTDGGGIWQTMSDSQFSVLRDVQFPGNGFVGYAVGDSGTILKTVDQGINWVQQNSPVTDDLYTIHFPSDSITGYIGGASNYILKTIDGGNAWTQFNLPNYAIFNTRIFFFNTKTGSIFDKSLGTNSFLYSTQTGGVLPPQTPTNLNAISGDSQVQLTWNIAQKGDLNVLGYNIYRSASSGQNYAKVNNTVVIDTFYTNSGLQNGIGYFYAITAVDTQNNESAFSAEVSAMPKADAPFPPQNIVIIAGNQSISLDWDPAQATSFPINGYNILRSAQSGGPYSKINSSLITATSFKDQTVTNGQEYFYIIHSIDDQGNESSNSLEVSGKPQQDGWVSLSSSTPNSLFSITFPQNSQTGYVLGSNSTILKTVNGGSTWDQEIIARNANYLDASFPENDQVGYIVGQFFDSPKAIYKTVDGGTTWQQELIPVSQDLNSIYFIDNITGYAVGFGGTILNTIDGTNWVQQTSNIAVSLEKVYFPNSQTGYVVGANGTVLKTIDSGTTWILLTQFTTKTLFDVYFFDSNIGIVIGEQGTIFKTIDGGDTWNDVSFSTLYNLLAISAFSSTVYICGEHGTILQSDDKGSSWAQQDVNILNDLFDINFPNDAQVGYICGSGGLILKTINGGLVAPSKPLNLSSEASDQKVILTWEAATKGTFEILAYKVFRRDTGGNFVPIASTPSLQFEDAGLTNGTEYSYFVRAIDQKGNESSNSNVISSVPFSLPKPVLNLKAEVINGSITLTWEMPSEGTYGIAGLVFKRAQRVGTPPNFSDIPSFIQIYPNSENSIKAIDTSAQVGVWYTYVIQTIDNQFNFSDNSNEANALIFVNPSPPLNLRGNDKTSLNGEQVIELEWDVAEAGTLPIAGYKIERSEENQNFSQIGAVEDVLKFTDNTVRNGKTYRYRIRSFDTDLNFSDFSEEIEIYVDATGWKLESFEAFPDIAPSLSFPEDENTGYFVGAGGERGGLYKTIDAGKTWDRVSSISNIVLPKKLFFLDNNYGFILTGNQIFKTEDGGKTLSDKFNVPSHIAPSSNYADLHINKLYFIDENIGFAAVGTKIYKTTNKGASWTEQLNPSGIVINAFNFPRGDQIGYAIGAQGIILKTNTGGDRWFQINYDSNPLEQDLLDISFPENEQIGYISANNGLLLKTTDGGNHWAKISIDINIDNVPFSDLFFKSLTSMFFINNNIGYISGAIQNTANVSNHILKTIDGGNTWSFYQTGTAEGILDIHFPENDQIGYMSGSGSGGNILKTTNGGLTWTRLDSELGSQFFNFTFIHFFNNFVGYTGGDNGLLLRTDDGGLNWAQITIPISNQDPNHAQITAFFVNNEIGYIGNEASIVDQNMNPIDSNQIMKTIDGGLTWKNATNFEKIFNQNAAGFNDCFFVDKNIGYIVGGAWDASNTGFLLRTIDGGDTWDFYGKKDGINILNNVPALEKVIFLNEKVGYIGGYHDLITYSTIFLKTVDGGENWFDATIDSKSMWINDEIDSIKQGQIVYSNDVNKIKLANAISQVNEDIIGVVKDISIDSGKDTIIESTGISLVRIKVPAQSIFITYNDTDVYISETDSGYAQILGDGSGLGISSIKVGKIYAASTTLSIAASVSDQQIHVTSINNFQIGQSIVIGRSTPEEETNEISDIDSNNSILTLSSGLVNNHNINSIVEVKLSFDNSSNSDILETTLPISLDIVLNIFNENIDSSRITGIQLPKNSQVGYLNIGGSRLFKTINKGMTWEKIDLSNYFPELTANFRIRFFNNNFGYILASVGLIKTEDGGLTWTTLKDNELVQVSGTGDILNITKQQNHLTIDSGFSQHVLDIVFPNENIFYALGTPFASIPSNNMLISNFPILKILDKTKLKILANLLIDEDENHMNKEKEKLNLQVSFFNNQIGYIANFRTENGTQDFTEQFGPPNPNPTVCPTITDDPLSLPFITFPNFSNPDSLFAIAVGNRSESTEVEYWFVHSLDGGETWDIRKEFTILAHDKTIRYIRDIIDFVWISGIGYFLANLNIENNIYPETAGIFKIINDQGDFERENIFINKKKIASLTLDHIIGNTMISIQSTSISFLSNLQTLILNPNTDTEEELTISNIIDNSTIEITNGLQFNHLSGEIIISKEAIDISNDIIFKKIIFPENNRTGYVIGSENLSLSSKGILLKKTDWGKILSYNGSFNKIHFPKDVVQEETGYIVGNNKTIFKTENSGITWNNIGFNTDVIINEDLDIISVFFVNKDIGYICANDPNTGQGFVLKTFNEGNKWNKFINIPLFNIPFFDIYFISENIGFVATFAGILLKTENGGNSWQIIHLPNFANITRILFESGTGYAIGLDGTILKTTDSGTTWEAKNSNTTQNLHSMFFNQNIGLVAGDDLTILKTTDFGETWNAIDTSGIDAIINTKTLIERAITSIWADHSFSIIIVNVSLGYTFKTMNGGQSWERQDTPLQSGEFVKDMFFSKDEKTGFLITNKGKILTNEGWIQIETGFEDHLFDHIFFIDNREGYIMLGEGILNDPLTGDLIKTNDGGSSWKHISLPLDTDFDPSADTKIGSAIYFPNKDIGYISHTNGIFKTEDGGITWQRQLVDNQDIFLAPDVSRFEPILFKNLQFTDENTGVGITESGRVYRTTTGGIRPQYDPPVNLAAEGLDSEIQLSWDQAQNGIFNLVGYNLYRSVSQNGIYEKVNLETIPNTLDQNNQISYLDQGLVNGIEFFYFVRALDEKGLESLDSQIVSAIGRPNPPKATEIKDNDPKIPEHKDLDV